MTVKELIIELLKCDMDGNVVLEDSIEFKDEYGYRCNGSCYQIEKVIGHYRETSLCFDNRQHFMKRGKSDGNT